MFIRVLNFQTTGNKKEEAVSIINNFIPKIRSLKGCKDCMFLVHESDNRYVFLAFWQSKEHADAAVPVIGPMLLPALNKISAEPVIPQLYEVYQFEREMV